METTFSFSDHPLVAHKLAHMRKTPKECPSREFVRLMREIGLLLAYEATKALPVKSKWITTERSGDIEVYGIFSKKPVIVPILRTGLVLAEGVREVIPTTYTGHIGLHNDHESDVLEEYMVTIPGNIDERIFFIVDPIIATGTTASRAIEILYEFGVPKDCIRFISIIITDDGQKRLMDDHPEGVQLFAANGSDTLRGTTVLPGLGSISSRLYRTG